MSRRIIIEFQNKDSTDRLVLPYELLQTSIANRWWELLEKALSDPNQVLWKDGVFYGKAFSSEEDIVLKMQKAVRLINDYGREQIPMMPKLGMSRAELNEMHDCFERFAVSPSFKSHECPEVFNAIFELNNLVHMCEQFLSHNMRGGHIELFWEPSMRKDFIPQDYQHFSADNRFGYLYLTYGYVGVPPLAAFFNRPESRPVLQESFTPGFFLSFRPDNYFNDWQQLGDYLGETWSIDINKEKLGIGAIPLARLTFPLNSSRTLLQDVKRFNRISIVRVCEEKKDKINVFQEKAEWPSHRELKHQLNLVPYVDLQFKFNYEACYHEALALLPRFVKHRNYDQSSKSGGEWKSLALRALDGDSTKTLYHLDYGRSSKLNYQATEIADLCPETMSFLREIVDIDSCERIRYMLLEPGARISVHSDAPDKDVCIALNIALNMPRNCSFFIDTNKDGSHNRYTKRIPFFPGSVMLLNNAKFHYVENLSTEPRIHLIVHGPLRFSEAYLLQCARRQNLLNEEKKVLRNLVIKESFLNPDDSPKALIAELRSLGMTPDPLPEDMALVVVDDPENYGTKPLIQTQASLYPFRYSLTTFSDLDKWLHSIRNEGYRTVVIVGAGTVITDTAVFLSECVRASAKANREGAPLVGHLMVKKETTLLPYLHEQFAILNYTQWLSLGSPAFGIPYPGKEGKIPGFRRSPNNVHDDYTPLWMDLDESKPEQKGSVSWGTEVIAAALKARKRVMNLPHDLRSAKKFSYPLNPGVQGATDCELWVKSIEQASKNFTYLFNNEPLLVSHYNNFRPQVFLSVAAGFKWAGIAKQYSGAKNFEKMVFMDFSARSLNYVQSLIESASILQPIEKRNWFSAFKRKINLSGDQERLTETISKFSKEGPSSHTNIDEKQAHENLKLLVQEYFSGSWEDFFEQVRHFRKADFHNIDFVSNPQSILELIPRDKQVLFWHSNAWDNNGALYAFRAQELNARYLELGRRLSVSLGLRVWKKKGAFELILGDSFLEPQVVLTDGCGHGVADKTQDFTELT